MALRGASTAYSGAPGAGQTDAKVAGTGMALVALAQLRNNARVAVAGSVDLFSNAFFEAQATDCTGKTCVRLGVFGAWG